MWPPLTWRRSNFHQQRAGNLAHKTGGRTRDLAPRLQAVVSHYASYTDQRLSPGNLWIETVAGFALTMGGSELENV
jgi:hypothetical protein